MKWTKIDIINKIKELDRETGLEGHMLPITFSNMYNTYAYYESKYKEPHGDLTKLEPIGFTFSNYLIDGRYTSKFIEDVITHEYIHYYMSVKLPEYKEIHGKKFKELCREFGISEMASLNAEIDNDFDLESLKKELVYVVKCNSCKREWLMQKKCDFVNNVDKYRCFCEEELYVNKEYRLIL